MKCTTWSIGTYIIVAPLINKLLHLQRHRSNWSIHSNKQTNLMNIEVCVGVYMYICIDIYVYVCVCQVMHINIHCIYTSARFDALEVWSL